MIETFGELHAAVKLEEAAGLIYDVVINAVDINGGWCESCERLKKAHDLLTDEAKALRQVAANKNKNQRIA